MRWFVVLALALIACNDGGPEGFLEPCQLSEDCASPEMECAQVLNQYSGFLTEERYCTLRCTADAQCPELICADWEGTELECLATATTGGSCGDGAIGDLSLQVCGM